MVGNGKRIASSVSPIVSRYQSKPKQVCRVKNVKSGGLSNEVDLIPVLVEQPSAAMLVYHDYVLDLFYLQV